MTIWSWIQNLRGISTIDVLVLLLTSILWTHALKNWETNQHRRKQVSPFLSPLFFDPGQQEREHFHTFAPAISGTQSCSISSAEGCGLIWLVGTNKVQLKFPLEKKRKTRSIKRERPKELTFTTLLQDSYQNNEGCFSLYFNFPSQEWILFIPLPKLSRVTEQTVLLWSYGENMLLKNSPFIPALFSSGYFT